MLRERGSGVERAVAPPPIIFASAVALGVVLGRLWPMSALPGWLGWSVGGLAAALGVAISAAAASRFLAAGTTFEPGHPASALVTTGIFGRTRNPLYCGMTLICAGVALMSGDLWILAVLAGALTLLHHGVVLREEAMLTRQFGDEYLRYKAQVRRWV